MTDGANGTDEVTYAWAPAEPKRRKNRSGLWIGIPVGATAVALIAASLVLIAPGASVAGVQIGGLTAGAAADAITARLAQTTVVVDSPAGKTTVSGADLGATVDAQTLADEAFAANPMWKPSSWFPQGTDTPITVNPATAASVLHDRLPSAYTAPVDAAVSFDAASGSYTVTPEKTGEGLDAAAVISAMQAAFDAGTPSTTVQVGVAPVHAPLTTDKAQETVTSLNALLDTVGFYVGDERTVPVDRATAASWLKVTADDAKGFVVTADAAAIEPTLATLAAAVNRDPVNAITITDPGGQVLKEETAGQTGRALGDTSGIAAAFAKQLAEGNGKYALTVTETPFQTTTLARRIEVNLTTQKTVLWENGQIVKTYTISSGAGEHATHTGDFRIGWKTQMQDMGCVAGYDYCTKDVPWVAYFNGDEGFHGTYWHNNFGTPMSHGCINMRIPDAKELYDWAYRGTPVSVHY